MERKISSASATAPPMLQELCIIAVPRTGTNQVVALLANCKKIKSRGEIFHPKFSEGLSAEEVRLLGRAARQNFVGNDDPNLRSFVRRDPGVLLNVLRDADGGNCVNSFKLFPGHLTIDKFKGDILPRERISFLFVLRRPIDSFISSAKAEITGKYFGIDTTGLRVRLDPAAFERRIRQWRNWYEKTSEMIIESGRQYNTLIYETDIACTIDQCFEKIREATIACGISPYAFEPPPRTLSGLDRQDRRSVYRKKVANWDEFIHQVTKRKLRKLAFAYFLPVLGGKVAVESPG
jgi:hypothetical protein